MADNEKRVLLVEDNSGDAILLTSQLQDARLFSFRIEHAETVGKGLELLRSGTFDVVLLDLNLPDSTGLATLATDMEAAPRVAVVVLTGFEDPSVGLEAVSSGAQDFLLKGQTTGPLVARALSYAAERHRLLRELEDALAKVKLFRGLLPVCASCRRIRDEDGSWSPLEDYMTKRMETQVTHGLCPECIRKLYPAYADTLEEGATKKA
jgi:CheY-like chemotaxis protein